MASKDWVILFLLLLILGFANYVVVDTKVDGSMGGVNTKIEALQVTNKDIVTWINAQGAVDK